MNVLIISGPTSSGKSYLANKIASKINATIINADSMQVYKELPILSAQESGGELYSIYSYQDSCNAALWANLATEKIEQSLALGKLPIVVGGTGLYIKCLIEGIAVIPQIAPDVREVVASQYASLGIAGLYELLIQKDPEYAKLLKPTDKQRVMRALEVYIGTGKSLLEHRKNHQTFLRHKHKHFTLMPTRELLHNNCNTRFMQMLKAGAVEEVRALSSAIGDGVGKYPIENTLGYKELKSYLNSEITLEEATSIATQVTRQYAKRQCTWFRNQFTDSVKLEFGFCSELDGFVDVVMGLE